MRRLDEHVVSGRRLLRLGYTTGTCAAAAAAAAARLLLTGRCPDAVSIRTPAGITCEIDVEGCEAGDNWAMARVMKDAGDDPDVTGGLIIEARVTHASAPGTTIVGGTGVGRVTREGLDQPPGEWAINSGPRAQIQAVTAAICDELGHRGGLLVEISVPGGEEVARRTFNPRLGIEGGISILGTTGIVVPMSEAALIDTIRLELSQRLAQGTRHLVVSPGSIGCRFAAAAFGIDERDVLICSNFIGATIDEAARLGFASLLLAGHAGKLVKVAAGVFDTHSRLADARAEVMCAHAALSGADASCIEELFACATTDAMVCVLRRKEILDATMRSLTTRLAEHLHARAAGDLEVEAVIFGAGGRELSRTDGADRLLAHIRTTSGEDA